MDRDLSRTRTEFRRTPAGDDLVSASRQAAIAAIRSAMGAGPVLLTGEPGVGKTWIGRRLAERTDSPWIWVDAFPGMTSDDLLAAIGMGLGLAGSPTRAEIARDLTLRSTDGRGVSLVFDEAHLASTDLLEDVRVLTNRLGQPDGFAALILIGQTPLAHRVESRTMAGLASRLAARVHLRSWEIEELFAFVKDRPRDEIEHLHRETSGNPRKILRLALAMPVVEKAKELPAARSHASIEPEPAVAPPEMAVVTRTLGPVVPVKPPIRMEDGLIEVGYDADLDVSDLPEVGPRPPATVQGAAEESIEDHYAALQAWDEWARNQHRVAEPVAAPAAAPAPVAEFPPISDDPLEADPSESATPFDEASQSWVDQGQRFAPYSQLFSRLARSVEKD